MKLVSSNNHKFLFKMLNWLLSKDTWSYPADPLPLKTQKIFEISEISSRENQEMNKNVKVKLKGMPFISNFLFKDTPFKNTN